MLNSVKKLHGFTIAAIDGEVGAVKEIYFDDAKWTIRYLVIETGGWFSGRKVLVSPFSVLGTDWDNESVHLDLTKEQIENGPDIDTDKPVSRQHEAHFSNHYGYPYYWAGPMVWGYTAYPTIIADRADEYAKDIASEHEKEEREVREKGDPHLRSSKEVIGYDIRATDDIVGHVEDFLIDDKDWSIQSMVVDTRNWLPGKKVLIPTDRIDFVSWEKEQIAVSITREEVESSAEYDPDYPPPAPPQNEVHRRPGTPPR